MMKNENAGAHCLGFAVEDIIWRGQRASIVDQRFPVGTPITTANLLLSTHSQANQPAERAPNHREQGRLEEQRQPDQGMTSTSGDAQTSYPPVNCSSGTARERPAREGSCNASSLERSGSVDAERDNTTVTNAPAPSSHVSGFDMRKFSAENLTRCTSPDGFNHPLESWSLSDWMTATLGELGEAANVLKKLNRVRDGITGNKETPEDLSSMLADEIADAYIYMDLFAQAAGIDLPSAVRRKFDKTSEKIGYRALATECKP